MYTKEEKQQMLEFFKARTEARIAQLERTFEGLAEQLESKIVRRLNNVSAALWNVKMKDVLLVERRQKPNLRLLLVDIEKAKESERGPAARRSFHVTRVTKGSTKRIVSSHK